MDETKAAVGQTGKGALTRRRIVGAARELMAEVGVDGVTAADIAARAGVSKGSLYYYFEDCAAIVRAVVVQELGEVLASFEQAALQATSASDALARIARAYVGLLHDGSPLAHAVLAPGGGPAGLYDAGPEACELRTRLHGLVAAQMERGKREGSVRPDVDVDLAAAGVVGTFVAMAAARPELGRSEEGRAELEGQLLGFVAHGVGAGPEGDPAA